MGSLRIAERDRVKAPSSMLFERPVPFPDGRYLAFAEVATASNAWMIENR